MPRQRSKEQADTDGNPWGENTRSAVPDFAPSDWRCIWMTHGRRCYLRGTVSPDIGERQRLYCHWHFVARSMPEIVDDYPEFERWLSRWANYCSPENHHPAQEIWLAVRGEVAIRSEPRGCGNFSCRHPANAVRPTANRPPSITPESVRAEVQTMEEQLTAQNRQLGLTVVTAPARRKALREMLSLSGGKVEDFSALALRAGYQAEEIAEATTVMPQR